MRKRKVRLMGCALAAVMRADALDTRVHAASASRSGEIGGEIGGGVWAGCSGIAGECGERATG